MRIESLKFKNINSLKGEWKIDFLSKEFVESGIFAIVGETGAGKSSILDAITLGLYGKTPRQRDITSSKNNLMTKFTAECYSEVIFRGKDNRRYRSRWYQHRAKKNPNGKLQTPKVLLEEIDKKTLATKIEEWRERVEDVTRLDFDRFCKCVMLAQGNFSAFLKANEREKSEILEEITDSSLYRKIGARVYKETKEKRAELERLKERLNIDKPLQKRERREYQNSLEELKRDIELLRLQLSSLRDKRGYLELLDKNIETLKDIESKLIVLKSQLSSIREAQRVVEKILDQSTKELQEFQDSFREKQQLISEVKGLDIRVDEIKRQKSRNIKKLNELEYRKDIELQKLKKIENFYVKESYDELFKEKNRYLELRYRCDSYKSKSKRLNEILERLSSKKQNYSNIEKELISKAKETEELKANLQIGEVALKVLELRAFLIEGEPCLVCGSREHNLEVVDDIPTNIDIEELKSKLDIASNRLEELKVEKKSIRRDIEFLREESQNLQREIKELNISDSNICSNIDELLEEVEFKILKLKEIEKRKTILDKIESIREDINQNRRDLESIEEKLESLKNRRDSLFIGDIDRYLDSLISKQNSLIEKKEKNQKDLEKIVRELREVEFNIKEREKKREYLLKEIDDLNSRMDILDLDKLNLEISKKEEIVSFKNQEYGRVYQILKRDNELIEKYQNINVKVEALEQELEILNTLNSLIGSSDGAKFAKFAQTVTMDYLLVLANRHLENLDKRYKIQQKGVLDFVVVDRYQAEEIRPVSTLSGGESFLVSLALALGLSDLAGRSINIETLFLDEGFGSLDAQSLESVLVGLDRLNSQGKIVGIISHIEAIKEAIPLKIEVKKSGGFGYLDSKYRA